MKKKYNFFISSTYQDLKKERNEVINYINKLGHFNLCMERFTGYSISQWDKIKQEINNSDIFILIIGGRYGSINSSTKKSYTEMEYDYALKQNKPIIVLFLDENYNYDGASIKYLKLNDKNLINFKEKVKKKIVKIIKKSSELITELDLSIKAIEDDPDIYISGWIRGDLKNIENKFKIGELSFNELCYYFRNNNFKIPSLYREQLSNLEEITYMKAYDIIIKKGGEVASSYSSENSIWEYIYDEWCPIFISQGLLKVKSVPRKYYSQTCFTAQGLKFNQLLIKKKLYMND